MTEVSKETCNVSEQTIEAVAEAIAEDFGDGESGYYVSTAQAAIKAIAASPEYKQLEAIRDSVIVLEEGAEPEVGDVVQMRDNLGLGVRSDAFIVLDKPAVRSLANVKRDRYEIIQRNGKPTIQLPKEQINDR